MPDEVMSPGPYERVDPALWPLLDSVPTLALSSDNLAAVRSGRRLPILPADGSGTVVERSIHHVTGAAGAPDVEVIVYHPPGLARPAPCVLHLHGGGFVMGSAAAMEGPHRMVSAALSCIIVTVEYRLAPETVFPGALEDAYAALGWVMAHAEELGVDPVRVGVSGESAGGGLAAALALLARDRTEYAVAFQHLIYPMLDDRTCTAVESNPHTGAFIWTAHNNRFGWTALLGAEPGGPDVSPYAAPARASDLSGLPPTYISTGALDLFLEEDLDYARRLMRSGVPVELHVYPGAFHAFELSPSAAVAAQARRDSLAALERMMAPRPSIMSAAHGPRPEAPKDKTMTRPGSSLVPSRPALSLAEATAALTAPGTLFELDQIKIDGREQTIWKNAPATLSQSFLAGRAFGNKTFIVYGEERVTFEAFARATLALATDLQRRGVQRGDRVAVIMRNLPEWPVAFFAAALVGAIVTPLNAWGTGPELAFGLTDSGAKIAIIDGERLERLTPHLASLPDLELLAVRAGPNLSVERVTALESILGPSTEWPTLPAGEMPLELLDPEDLATIFYTSGTTGAPKGALGTHRNAGCALMAGIFSFSRSCLRRGEAPPVLDPTAPQKAVLVSIPFFHTTGCNAVLMPALVTGQKMVCQRRFDAGEALGLIEQEHITSIGGVAAVVIQLLQHPDRGRFDLSSLETVSYGGAASPAVLVETIARDTSGLPGTGWGMTETSATHTHHLGEDYLERPDSCGPPAPVSQIRIIDADGADVPPGAVGELLAYGPNVVKGYWNRPDATAATFVDGWVRTGDLARVDEEGFCYVVDRAKDIIIRGGENIFCPEIEAILFEHPAVAEAALIASPDPVLGEVPVAVVTLAPGRQVEAETLRRLVASRTAAYKVPVTVHIASAPLPRNAAGKILKAELKAQYADRTVSAG